MQAARLTATLLLAVAALGLFGGATAWFAGPERRTAKPESSRIRSSPGEQHLLASQARFAKAAPFNLTQEVPDRPSECPAKISGSLIQLRPHVVTEDNRSRVKNLLFGLGMEF